MLANKKLFDMYIYKVQPPPNIYTLASSTPHTRARICRISHLKLIKEKNNENKKQRNV